MESSKDISPYLHSRRRFLRDTSKIAAAAGSFVFANSSLASALTSYEDGALVKPAGMPRTLKLVNAHTWEKLDVVYWLDGEYVADSLVQINHLMRDHRANEATNMDLTLLDDLYRLYRLLDSKERIHVLSGYRTPETNAKLRKRSSGVAKYSLHMEGRALDMNLPGRSARDIQKAALSLKSGGVGYYGSSGFVHIDTGPIRNWRGS